MGSWWLRTKTLLGARRSPGPYYYAVEADLHTSLQELAVKEQRPVGEVHRDLLIGALKQCLGKSEAWKKWEGLSPREQQVVALACLGYTNRQIAALICVSAETIKTHVHNALAKFGMHGKAELRLSLSDWDFSAWVPGPKI